MPRRPDAAPTPWGLVGSCLLIVLAAGLIRSDTAAGLVLKFALSKLVYSTSDGAILFLLGFSGLALLCGRLPVPRRSQVLASVLLGAGLALGHGLHLLATLSYHGAHDVPLSAHVYHWAGGVNSYTTLLHSHLGKAAMAPLSAWLSERSHYDTGGALARVVPTWQLAGIALGFLAASAGVLLHMPRLLRGYGHRPALMALYLVCAATATKCIFDGGLLAFAVPPSILVLASFMACADDKAWSQFWLRRGWLMALCVLAAYGALWLHLSTDDVPLVGAWLFLLVVMLLLMTGRWRGWQAWACRLALLAYLALNAMLDANGNLVPLLSAVGPSHRAAWFDATGRAHPQSLAQWQGLPVHRLYVALGDDPWKPRKALVWTDPAAGMHKLSVAIRLLTIDQQQGHITPTPSLRVAQISPADKDWIGLVLQDTASGLPPLLPYGTASVLSRNNYYVWLYQVDLLLRQAGWTNYILMPHTQGNVRAD